MAVTKILHLSDLHVGAHKIHLVDDLEALIRDIAPDTVVITGDVADNPTVKNLQDASKLIERLVQACRPSEPQHENNYGAPTIIVPGNHDRRYFGNLIAPRRNFDRVFTTYLGRDFFCPTRRLWIYGMDSARLPWLRTNGFRANGFIDIDDFRTLRKRFLELRQQHGLTFDQAYKIIAVHHHPLPVRYDDKLQNWLTLDNAGSLLGTALACDIDLILHGHEHVQARSAFRSTINNGNGSRELHVISSGSTLKDNNTNYLNVITIGPNKQVHIDSYSAEYIAFDRTAQVYEIRSLRAALDRGFEDTKRERGYSYREVASITVLNADGDCRRVVECDDLHIQDPVTAKRHLASIALPQTAGYIDKNFVRIDPRSTSLPGLRLSCSNHDPRTAGLDFGRELQKGETLSFEYSWWSSNAFAMDERQFRFTYDEAREKVEFTHFPVQDPIQHLTIVVQFPTAFGAVAGFDLSRSLSVRVTELGSAQLPETSGRRVAALERELEKADALRFIGSLSVAALRVPTPVPGHSYGIQWQLPPLSSTEVAAGRAEINKILEKFLRRHKDPTKPYRTFLQEFLSTAADMCRLRLLQAWTGEVEASLMMFDKPARRLVTLAILGVRTVPITDSIRFQRPGLGTVVAWLERRSRPMNTGSGRGYRRTSGTRLTITNLSRDHFNTRCSCRYQYETLRMKDSRTACLTLGRQRQNARSGTWASDPSTSSFFGTSRTRSMGFASTDS